MFEWFGTTHDVVPTPGTPPERVPVFRARVLRRPHLGDDRPMRNGVCNSAGAERAAIALRGAARRGRVAPYKLPYEESKK